MRKDLEQGGAVWKIESKRIDEVLQGKGKSFYQWRDCDFDTLQEIMPIINSMTQRSLPSDDVSFLNTTSWCTAEFKALMRCEELRPLWGVAMEPWPQILKYHSEMLLDFAYVRFALCRPNVSAQHVLDTHGACLQGGLAKLWRANECDGLASGRYIARQKDQWSKAYPDGLADAQKKIENDFFKPRGLRKFLAFQSIKEMDGCVVKQPNQIAAGGSWLVYGYKHPDMPDIKNWENTTVWSDFFHGSLWYGARNIMENNYLLPSASEELGHRKLHWGGESGVYLTPHMYTSLYYAEPQLLFQDGVYWRLVYQLAARGAPLFHKKNNGNQYVFPPSNVQITHVWVQPCTDIAKGTRIHISWNPLLECCLRPLAPRHDDVAAVTSGLFVSKRRRRDPPLKGSELQAGSSASTSPGSSSNGGQAQAQDVTIDLFPRVWDAMVYFHALADLVRRIQHNYAPTWDSLNMSTLRDLASLWCVNLVSLEAIEEDKEHGVHSVVMYEDVLQSLATATTKHFVDFRNRSQSYDQLKNKLIGLVSKGINLYLGKVVAKQGKRFAEMTLHYLAYAGSTAFAIENLDGRWMSSQASEKCESKESEIEQVIAIKYRARPKRVAELRGNSSSSGSANSGWYQAHVRRGSDALKSPF